MIVPPTRDFAMIRSVVLMIYFTN